MINKNPALITGLLLVTPFALHAETVRQAVTDGMVLNLGNYAQQIKVRAKSIGSGDCPVEFSIEGQSVVVVGPVKKYSDWIGIGPTYLEPAAVKLGMKVKCDDGAITQVTYSK
jgi:hypothetical protein